MTAGAINDEGGASRFSTSKNLRHTIGSSEAAACTRSRYRFTRLEPGGRVPSTCGYLKSSPVAINQGMSTIVRAFA